MYNLFKNLNQSQALHNSIIVIMLIFFYYKLFFEFLIPITGDELNSILVYTSNIKTLLLKNFPGNVVFFHFIGYINSQIFGNDLITYRSLTYLFLILHFVIFKKIDKNNLAILLFLFFTINSNIALYSSFYFGYIFTSLIYVLIYYLLKNNNFEKYNKWILFLLFLQTYNHLVNIYLSIPIMISLFFYSNKKKFFKDWLYFYFVPSFIFYFISALLTGISLLKIQDTSFINVTAIIFNDFYELFFSGFDKIFFYEAYQNVSNFNIIFFFEQIFLYDKIIFLTLILSVLIAIYNLRSNKIPKIFSLIILFHLVLFFLINKMPAPRILTGFYAFYFLFIYSYFGAYKIVNLKIFNALMLVVLSLNLFNFNYLKKVSSSVFIRDITFKENELSIKILSKKCILENNNFSEIQKRNFYFNYINICKRKYNLTEFLKFYRS